MNFHVVDFAFDKRRYFARELMLLGRRKVVSCAGLGDDTVDHFSDQAEGALTPICLFI